MSTPLSDFLVALREITKEERVNYFEVIRKTYCIRCGKRIPTEDCNCWKH